MIPSHHVRGMQESIRESLAHKAKKFYLPSHTTYALIEEAIERYWENKCVISWCDHDVHFKANDMGLVLTQEDALQILKDVVRTHDCEYGITWMSFEMRIPDFARKMTSSEVNSAADVGYLIDDAVSPPV
jgi:hypothetical protein